MKIESNELRQKINKLHSEMGHINKKSVEKILEELEEEETEELKCPNCGSTEIEEDDCIDTEYISSTTMSRRYCGCCTKCEALLQWEEVFTFSNYQGVEVYG